MADQEGSEVLPEHRHHAHYVAEQMRRDKSALEKQVERSPLARQTHEQLEANEREGGHLLELLDPPVYTLPPVARKTIAPDDLDELNEVFATVRERHHELVGTRADIALATLAGDVSVYAVRRRLRSWAERYVAGRLARRNARDVGPVERFERIHGELVPFFEQVIRRSAVHVAFLRDLPHHVSWLIFMGTWADRLEFTIGPGLDYGVRLLVEPPYLEPCRHNVDLFGWPHSRDLARVFGVLRAHASVSGYASVADPVSALEGLAADIEEMRPLLLRGFRPANAAVQVTPEMFLDWDWGGDQVLGHVGAYTSERALLESVATRESQAALCVGYDGILACDWAHWIDSTTLPEPDALALNVLALAAIHERLLGFWSEIDVAGLASELRSRAQTSEPVAESLDESVAAVCHELVRRDEQAAGPGAVVEGRRESTRRVPSLRLERFLAALRQLGCEVRQGKGSEVNAYRPGGKIAVVGRHVRNREVRGPHVRRLLSLLGISQKEWWSVLG